MFKHKMFLCPCCGFETLAERGAYLICRVCWWEDDGQDEPDADKIRGGPNSYYALTHARKNFRDHGHMYDLDNAIDVVKYPSAERKTLINYCLSVIRGEEPHDEALFEALLLADRLSD